MKAFIIDESLCNGCYNCQVACKDEHVGNEWAPYAKEQPIAGQFWMNVKQTEHGQLPVVRVEYTPVLCQHCEKCPLVESGVAYRREDGLVILDPTKAADKAILDACPYGVVYWNEGLGIAQKCTGCAHLVDEGKIPHCVDFCGTGALRFVDMEDAAEEIAQCELLPCDADLKPHVFYKNMPHLFLAGELWDEEVDEDIIGATVILSQNGEVVATQESDDFGDFKFEKLDEGTYDIHVDRNNYESIDINGIVLDKSRYIGDYTMNYIGED